jgi:multidrug efflux pump subunit AcrA (membrane-fusion protein)
VQSKQFVISQLDVVPGEAVQTGQTLCVLTDYSELYIEGQAFEYDADDIVRAAEEGLEVTAFPEQKGTRQPVGIRKLRISQVTNEIDRESRALHFYVDLPNEIARQSEQDGHKFMTWKYKPGQRMQLRVPVEEWKDVIVLPVDAIAQDGLETFVFVENGDHFDRQPVHVQYRDQFDAVIENDGSIFPGDLVAMNSAHQLQMAIKNKSGGGADPHAGHHH